ncbi:MAG: phospholipid carrier-dependent glycosyltransferase [Deltaproteobacteria bacterium]|nr:phospholipid carrier-dependent glycosyltransferase [Deltaproteobacteria bacterium]
MKIFQNPQSAAGRCYLCWFYLAVVLGLSYFTYFRNYENPPRAFWDEVYHIPAAAKYVKGVFFMEAHPPLGQLLFAAGEYLFEPNKNVDVSQLLITDKANEIPSGYSFKGVRFFPALMGWISCGLFFLLLYEILGNTHAAFLFSFLMIFDNALIVHSPGVLREGILIFFVLLALYAVVRFTKRKSPGSVLRYLALGILAALPVCVKMDGAISALVLLGFLGFDTLYRPLQAGSAFGVVLQSFLLRLVVSLLSAALTFCAVWYVHFALGKKVEGGLYYGSSLEYQEILHKSETADPSNFPVMFRDSLKYILKFHDKVPAPNYTNPEEFGSPTLHWPFGGRAIRYRADQTPSGAVRYRYLLPNPVGLAIGDVAVALAIILVVGRVVFATPITDDRLFFTVGLICALYVGLMLFFLIPNRSFYLYHYLLPLTLSFCLAAALFSYCFRVELKEGDGVVFASLFCAAIAVTSTFYFFAPLTYERPITTFELSRRAWLSMWDLVPLF